MRRLIVTSSLLIAFASPLAAESGPFDLQFEPVSDGVILAYRPDVPRYPVIGNAVIIPSKEGVVLVDGGGARSVVDQIAKKIQSLDSGPLLDVIITHWHDDHTVSLDHYRDVWPDVRFIAHPHTRERILHKVQPRVGNAAASAEEFCNTARKRLESGANEETGEPLTPVQIERAREIVADAETIVAQKRLNSVVVPDVTTTGGLVLRVGDRVIEIHHLGPGNTMGDLVVYLPDEKILIGGDIVTYPVPFGFPRLAAALIPTMERLLTFEFRSFIPGHGPVFHDDNYIRSVLALQRHAVEEIQRMSNQGTSAEEIRKRIVLSPYDAAVTGNDPGIEYFFTIWYLDPIVGNAARELY